MILNHFCNRFFLVSLFILFWFFEAIAVDGLDNKVKKLTLELRCMTCQNQSIYDSDAEFSNDIKQIVRSKFKEGKTEKEIKEFLVSRYGEYILFRPLFNYKNLFLWGFPFILLGISIFFFIYNFKKK